MKLVFKYMPVTQQLNRMINEACDKGQEIERIEVSPVELLTLQHEQAKFYTKDDLIYFRGWPITVVYPSVPGGVKTPHQPIWDSGRLGG